ncbi:MAG TPA: hypothetical protein VLK33_10295 [Terriglobales bacterium]|nr:hypothetical protein [Terriglobales bacterium]
MAVPLPYQIARYHGDGGPDPPAPGIEGAGAQPGKITYAQRWDARHYRSIDISRQTDLLSGN